MKEQNKNPPLFHLDIFFLSFAGIGFFPYAPGTIASFATLPLLWAIELFKLPVIFLVPIWFFALVGSIFTSDAVQNKYQLKDPGWIVIDEVLGMFIGYFILKYFMNGPVTLLPFFILTLAFRFFDIVKVFPANKIDELTSGFGTIMDDIPSGIYAGLFTSMLHFMAPSLLA